MAAMRVVPSGLRRSLLRQSMPRSRIATPTLLPVTPYLVTGRGILLKPGGTVSAETTPRIENGGLVGAREGFEMRSRRHSSESRKNPIEHAGMRVCIDVRAAVSENGDAIVAIRRVQRRGQHGAAGRDAAKNQRIDVVRAEQEIEVGSCKRGNPALGHDQIPCFNANRRMEPAAFALEKLLVRHGRLHRAQKCVARTGLGNAGSKRHLHVNDAHSSGARAPQYGRDTADERLFIGVRTDDALLKIERDHRRAGRREQPVSRHGPAPLSTPRA